jgi:signal transduction histidine kinase
MPALVEIDSQRRHELGDRSSIGRGGDNAILLEDPMVSRNHAEVVRAPDGSYRVRDLGSRRGTFVGTSKVDDAPLCDGDELLIGPIRLRFELGRPSSVAGGESEELRKLRAIVELSRAIGVEHDLDRLLERVLATCFQLLRADRGLIIVYEPQSKTPCAMVARSRSGAPVEDGLSTSVLSQIMVAREPYLRTAIDGDLALQRSESLSAQGVRSLIAVPLRYEADETEWLGVIHLDSQATNKVFQQRDLELLCAVAGQAALAIKNAMLVRKVQAVQSDEWRRLERVVKNLPVGVVVLDDQRRCLLVNEWVTARAAAIGEVVPLAPVERLAGVPCDRMTGELREQVTVGSPESTFILNAHSSGDGRETVIVISDITAERAQQAKAAHQDRLALIGQLAGGIAHDFNNLLFIILNYAGMLEESLAVAEARDDARMISQAATSATELVRQLLAFSRREAVRPKVIDLSRLVRTMEKLLQRTVGPGIDLVIDVAAPTHHVLMDPSQLEQIVMNLVVNARDAVGGHGTITIRTGRAEHDATIEVIDTGCGMTPDVAARVFEPYFTTKALGKGTGLGLATVHGIVEHVGGHITVASEVGHGSTFRIALPRTDLAPEQTSTIPTGPVARGRVLLVDDDDQLRRLTERMLRNAGYHVEPAASGAEAIAVARRDTFDILLTDLVMPGMSGRDLARELVSEQPHLRVVFMSGYHSGTAMPDWQFIAKPFDRKILLAKIGHVQPGDLRAV